MTEEMEREIAEAATPEPIAGPAAEERFPILISPLWRVLLVPFGATAERAYVEIEEESLHVRFGWLFDHRFPLEEIEGVGPTHWPVWAGVGWRTNFRGTMGVVGTYVNVVEVRFKEPQRVRMLLPMPCRRLVISLEEPRDFVAALGRRVRAPRGEAPRRRRAARAA